MARGWQAVFAMSAAVVCWLGMMLVHECGHVLGAWVTGGHVERVVFGLMEFSRTDLAENPHPLIVVWAGPVFGAMLPVAAWGVMMRRLGRWVLPGVFAGFCLIANGLYIGVGSFLAIGDAKEMMRDGSAMWMLWLFGVVATAGGFWVWHGLGTRLGMGKVLAREIWVAAVLAAGLIGVGAVW